MTNQFLGLARGPIDHDASSVINVIANGPITMGSAVALVTTIPSAEILPRVEETDNPTVVRTYGIAVGGDTDGIYGDGSAASDDSTRATASAGQGVVVVTQGRCLARVDGSTGVAIVIGSPLAASTTVGVLEVADTNSTNIIARALQASTGSADIIAIDVQREGVVQ